MDEYAYKPDLTAFLNANRPDLPSTTSFSFISVKGGTNPQSKVDAGVEASIDIQYTTGVASSVPITFVSVGPVDVETATEFFTALEDEANYLLTLSSPPTVLTSSYSLNEVLISRSLATQVDFSAAVANWG